jgi:serine/threonine protein phosphatase PrpC
MVTFSFYDRYYCVLFEPSNLMTTLISGDLWSYNSERDLFVVSPEPDVSVYNFDCNQNRFIILASDGVWNMMSPDDAVNCVWSSAKSIVSAYGFEPKSYLVSALGVRAIKNHSSDLLPHASDFIHPYAHTHTHPRDIRCLLELVQNMIV